MEEAIKALFRDTTHVVWNLTKTMFKAAILLDNLPDAEQGQGKLQALMENPKVTTADVLRYCFHVDPDLERNLENVLCNNAHVWLRQDAPEEQRRAQMASLKSLLTLMLLNDLVQQHPQLI